MKPFHAAALLLAALPMVCAAQENTAARSLAATCANCHGTDGRSVTRDVPSLAGVPRQNLVAALQGFRNGTKPATVMHQIAKGYSEPQIEALASYFSRQTP